MISTYLGYLSYPNHTTILLTKEKAQVTTVHDANPNETEIYFAAWFDCPSTGSYEIRPDRSSMEHGIQELSASNIHIM